MTKHAKSFGPYTIEWPIENARHLGCIPVFYVPTGSSSPAPSRDNNGASLIHRLGEIQQVLERLARIAAMPANDPGAELFANQEAIGCSVKAAQNLINATFSSSLSPLELKHQLNAVMGFFYPCDNARYTGPLHYYEQREWRLVGRFQSRADPTTEVKPVPSDLKTALFEMDRSFFEKTITIDNEKFNFIDACGVYKKVFGKHILEYASRIFCPPDQVTIVQSILHKGGITLSVESLETPV